MALFNRLLVAGLPLVPKAIVYRFARRYVAGETLEQAVATVRDLNRRGAMATLDVLGEEVTEAQRSRMSADSLVGQTIRVPGPHPEMRTAVLSRNTSGALSRYSPGRKQRWMTASLARGASRGRCFL